MEDWFGLRPTGRTLREPTGQLVELVDDEDIVCLAIEYDPPWRGWPPLQRAVSLVRSFLEYPMVVGLVELQHADPDRGRFVYPTGSVLTVKELLRTHSDLGHVLGPRAALELMYLAGQILREAAATGAMQGCFSHGGVTPWRITVRDDANVQVVGHGLPLLDVLAWRDEPERLPDADSIRYSPPERLSGIAEDEAADTASLTILGYEMLTGRPLYPGHDLPELLRSASISEAVPMLSRPNDLPRDIAQVFARALVFDPDSRLRGEAWLHAIAELLDAHRDGDGLEAAVARVRGSAVEGTRRAKIRQTTETSSYPASELARLAAEEPETPGGAEDRPARWQKVDRSRRPGNETPAPAGETSGPPRRRRREPAFAVAEEEVVPGGDLPLLDLDDLSEEEEDDLVLEEAPVRPRLRRRLDTANVPRLPPARPAASPAPDDLATGTLATDALPTDALPTDVVSTDGLASDGPATGTLPTGGIPRRRRRNEPS